MNKEMKEEYNKI